MSAQPEGAPAAAGEGAPAAADVVLRFLESVARPSESRFYLDLFRGRPPEQFAAVAVDANVARDALDAVVLDLRFLAALGLVPTVMLGLFQPAEADAQARSLLRRLARAGVPAEAVAAGPHDALRGLLRGGTLPIVTFTAAADGDADSRVEAAGRILCGLGTRKLLFLHRPGGLRQAGALVPVVNLSTDVPALLASKELTRKEAALVAQSRRLVMDLVAHPLVVAITSPLDLFRELFTVKGAGTLLRRGATLVRHEGWEGVDRARLSALLASSFGRPPVPAFFDRPVLAVLREEAWRGVAVLEDAGELGAYLTKFAVGREAQGEGIARDLWDAVAQEAPRLTWRARPDNPVAQWYVQLADGLVRLPGWTVYWKGLTLAEIPRAVGEALARPVDLPAQGP